MSLRKKLDDILDSQELGVVMRSYDVVGNIAVVKIPEPIRNRSQEIAEAIMQSHKEVKTVLYQSDPVSGIFRTRSLKYARGEKKTATLHKEAGCVFRVDLARCYFSPRLSYERMRISRQIKPSEIVVNMFAGVGCYSILIAKYGNAKKVYSIDINPSAIHYMRENIRLNRVVGIVVPIEGDSKEIIERKMLNAADRVLMPLPEKAYEYLGHAVMALKSGDGSIHYYDFVHAKKNENPVAIVEGRVTERMRDLGVEFEVSLSRIVRRVGPRWFQIVLDLLVHKRINNARTNLVLNGAAFG